MISFLQNLHFFYKNTTFIFFKWRNLFRLLPLYKEYAGVSPYRLCYQVFKGGVFDGHVYGETPLYIYDFMGKFLKKGDTFIDLGCGRGEGLLYLCQNYAQKGVGIDLVEPFIQKGNRVVKKMDLNCLFLHQNLLKSELLKADAYYIAGTCMEDDVIFYLVSECMRIKASLIFNLSFSLEEYGLKGYQTKEVSIVMPFGKTELYIHQKIRGD